MEIFAIIPQLNVETLGFEKCIEHVRITHLCHAMSTRDVLDDRSAEHCLTTIEQALILGADVSANAFVTAEIKYCLGNVADKLLNQIQATPFNRNEEQFTRLTALISRLQSRQHFKVQTFLTFYWANLKIIHRDRPVEMVLIVKANAILEASATFTEQLEYYDTMQETKDKIKQNQDSGKGINILIFRKVSKGI